MLSPIKSEPAAFNKKVENMIKINRDDLPLADFYNPDLCKLQTIAIEDIYDFKRGLFSSIKKMVI
jgi:hypothetical protein